MRSLICTLLLSLVTVFAQSPVPPWSASFVKGQELAKKGSYAEAIAAYHQALSLSTQSNMTEAQFARIHSSIAATYDDLGNFIESEKEYRMAMAVIEHTFGQGSLPFAVLQGSLALLPTQKELRPHASLLLSGALARAPETTSTEDMALARRCLSLNLLYQSRFAEAEPILIALLAEPDQQQQVDLMFKAGVLDELGSVRVHQQRFNESIILFQQSLALLDSSSSLNKQHVMSDLNNLAVTYVKLKDYSSAEATCRRALSISENVLGPSHPTTALFLGNYAVILRHLGRKQEAKLAASRATDIVRSSTERNGTGMTVDISALH